MREGHTFVSVRCADALSVIESASRVQQLLAYGVYVYQDPEPVSIGIVYTEMAGRVNKL